MNNKNNISNPAKVEKTCKKDVEGMYFIKDIENLTGIKAYTLRVWEQRYGLLDTKRTDTNIRYYDDDDLRFLISVGILNANGVKISNIAKLNKEDVQKRARVFSESQIKNEGVMQCLGSAMMSFKESDFNHILNEYIKDIGMENTMFNIIFPFMQHLGLLWLDGSISVAHEHFVTNLLKKTLYTEISKINIPLSANAKRYVLFIPNGESHKLSLLVADYMLRARGQWVFSLGDSVPLEELNLIVKEVKADALFCAITSSTFPQCAEVYMRTLKNNFAKQSIILTGNYIVSKKLTPPDNVFITKSAEEIDQVVAHIENLPAVY